MSGKRNKVKKSIARVVTREDAERALRNTMSNRMAARYLGISLETWEKWSKYYVDDNGISLYEKHCNKQGEGVKKYKSANKQALIDVLEGKIPLWWIGVKSLKEQLIQEGYIEEKCDRCGYHERRNVDMKVPLILYFRDMDKRNAKLDNLQLLCYNCYFISVSDVFEKKQIAVMENYDQRQCKSIDWDLPEKYHEDYTKAMGTYRQGLYESEIKQEDFVKEEPVKEITVEDIKEELEQKDEDFGLDLVSYLKK